jgi:hypothetical protein
MADMNERRSKWLAPVLLAATLVALPPVYVGTYIATGQTVYSSPGGPLAMRVYPAKWLAQLFVPAAKIESAIRGNRVSVTWTAGGITVMPNP